MIEQGRFLESLKIVIADCEQLARHLFYAKALIKTGDDKGASLHLDNALQLLNIIEPEQVGLSSRNLGLKK